MKVFMIGILSVFTFISCQTGKELLRSSDTMQELSFREQGMMRYGTYYKVIRKGDNVDIVINVNSPSERIVSTGLNVLDSLQKIINKYEMYKYKNTYVPKMEIMDGTVWSLKVRYTDDKASFSSTGSNAWPDNGLEAFQELKDFFQEKFGCIMDE